MKEKAIKYSYIYNTIEEIYKESVAEEHWVLGKVLVLLRDAPEEEIVYVGKEYTDFNCPECGAALEVYYDGTTAGYPENMLIRHCNNCGCDWVNDYLDDGSESELQRKFWG